MGYTIVELLKSCDNTKIPEVRIANSGEKDDNWEKGLKLAKWLI